MNSLLVNPWENLLINPLFEILRYLSVLSLNNLGLGILALTLIIRVILFPLTLPALKVAQKQKEISGELSDLKERFKDDKKKLAEEQLKLFQKHGINPAAGCLPQILQLVVLIALYQVFIKVLGFDGQASNLPTQYAFIETRFLYLDLLKPDPLLILPGLAGAAQFLMTKMMLPVVKREEKLAKKTEDKKDDFMYNMQEQMLYLGPVFTVLISWKLPAGLSLYWLATTIFSIIQQGWVSRGQAGGRVTSN